MLRASLAILLLTVACSVGPSTDTVFYKPVIEFDDTGVRTRELLVTGNLEVLGVESKFDGSVGVRHGTVKREDWETLRSRLAGARHLRGDTTRKGSLSPTFQIDARLGDDDISLMREPGTPIEKDVTAARERLEAIWAATPEAADPVAAAEPFLSSIQPDIRGLAARTLLKLWNRELVDPATKAAAERALRSHLEVEEDRKIRHAIRDVIDQPEDGE